jgi:predicted MFS family arabinose efflux permease
MLPMSIGGVLGDLILGVSGYPMLFAVAWGLAVAALVVALPLRDKPIENEHAGGAEEHRARGFTAPLTQRNLRPVWWISMIFFTVLAAIFVFLKTYVMERGIGTVGGFFTVYTGVALFLRVFFGWLPDRVGPVRVLAPALVSLAAGLVALAYAESSAMVLGAGALCGIGHAYAFPILFGLVVSRARDSERGSAVAIYTGFSDLGMVIGGPMFGAVLDAAGYTAMYAFVAGFMLLGLAVFLPWYGRPSARP